MKIFKIVIGVSIILVSINSCVRLSETEHGAGFFGVLIGTFALGGFGVWLIKTGVDSK